MVFHGSKETIPILCDLQNLAHLSHFWSCPCPLHSISNVPPIHSPAAGLLHVLFLLTVTLFPDFFH